MNFKKPIISKSCGRRSKEKELAIAISISESGGVGLKPRRITLNKVFTDTFNPKRIAFSFTEEVVIVVNPEGIESYEVNIPDQSTRTICNLDLAKSICEAFKIKIEKGTINFRLVPCTRYNGYETFKLELRD